MKNLNVFVVLRLQIGMNGMTTKNLNVKVNDYRIFNFSEEKELDSSLA